MVPLIACIVFAVILTTSSAVGYHMREVAFALYVGLLMGLFGASLQFVWAGWLLAVS